MQEDANYSQQVVPQSARKNTLALSAVMLGLTFFRQACGQVAHWAPG